MNSGRWKLILYLAAIFVAGGASGWMVAVKNANEKVFRVFRHEEVAHKMKECVRQELQLTDEQRRKIDSIIDDSAEQMKAWQGQHMKRIAELVSNRNEQIMAVLNPEQQKKFQASEERRQQRIREKFRSYDGPREREYQTGDRKRREGGMRGDKCETNCSGETQNGKRQEP
jgi:Spy/CpxP family protein refolding chaperone